MAGSSRTGRSPRTKRYWWHGWTYPLHVGSVLGPASKAAIWLLACLVLFRIAGHRRLDVAEATSFGQFRLPTPARGPVPPGLLAAMIALAIALPGVGLSMILIVAAELFPRLKSAPAPEARTRLREMRGRLLSLRG